MQGSGSSAPGPQPSTPPAPGVERQPTSPPSCRPVWRRVHLRCCQRGAVGGPIRRPGATTTMPAARREIRSPPSGRLRRRPPRSAATRPGPHGQRRLEERTVARACRGRAVVACAWGTQSWSSTGRRYHDPQPPQGGGGSAGPGRSLTCALLAIPMPAAGSGRLRRSVAADRRARLRRVTTCGQGRGLSRGGNPAVSLRATSVTCPECPRWRGYGCSRTPELGRLCLGDRRRAEDAEHTHGAGPVEHDRCWRVGSVAAFFEPKRRVLEA